MDAIRGCIQNRKVGEEMDSNQISDEERAKRAEERLMQIPRDQLGPAGRILVDNPRSPTSEQRRAAIRPVEGNGLGDMAEGQLQLRAGAEEG